MSNLKNSPKSKRRKDLNNSLQKDIIQTDFVQLETTNLPYDFPHEPPVGYRYETLPFKRNVISIWTVYDRGFVYNGHTPTRCIWGFYDTKKQCYYAPINSTKQGDQVDIESTTPYSSMQLNLNPLAYALYSKS